MKRFAVFAALWVGIAVAIAPGCGTAPKVCGADNCQGCCDENGECHAGSGLFECGGGGEACVKCPANDVCKDAQCQIWVGGEYDGGFVPDPDSGTYRGDGGIFFTDAGRPDAGADGGTDGGKPDGGTDGGRADGGTDAGVDAGFDAGTSDAGLDGGAPDAGDAGNPDAGDGG